jgi:hypothetical protein
MDSTLFAFKVARPAEIAGDSPLEFSYDPRTQTAMWSGSTTAIAALHCTYSRSNPWQYCDAYGNYCNGSGNYGSGGWECDG